MFKDQVTRLEERNRDLQQRVTHLEDKVITRDAEIQRMQNQYQGGASFDNIKQISDVDRISQERQKMIESFEDMANMLDMPMFRLDNGTAPINFQQVNQIFVNVQNLKAKLDDANQDKNEMQRQIERIQSDKYNQASLGNMMSEQEVNSLKTTIRDLEDRLAPLQDENRRLKA